MSNNYQPLPAPNYNNPYNQNNNQYAAPYQGQAYPNQPQQYYPPQQNAYNAPNNYNNYNNYIAPPVQNPVLINNQLIYGPPIMVGIGDDVNSKLLYYQNMNTQKKLGEMVMYGVAEQIRALLPFSLNQVVIKDRSNALTTSVVKDRIVQPLLATNPNVNPELITNHTLIKVC